MHIQHEENGKTGRFYIENEGTTVAEMSYSTANNEVTIEHTEIDDSLRGKNIGLQLVTEGVEYARSNDLKIVPQCSFAAAIFSKKKEFHDVLATSR